MTLGFTQLMAAGNRVMGLPRDPLLMLAAVAFFAVVITMMGLAVVQLATGRYRLDLETHVMCSGIGLATFAVVTVLLSTFGFGLTWWSFLLSACGLFVAGALRDILAKQVSVNARVSTPVWTRDAWFLVVAMCMAAALFGLYLNGAFTSRWLIDDDSWLHASSAKFIAVWRTCRMSIDARAQNPCYLDPYPPAYPVMMGVLHQITPSIFWTLKFFNALIVCLGIVYFYVMVKGWTKQPSTALWMTGALWVCPCFMSHFIWSQSMAITCFFPALWALERGLREPRWLLVAAVATAGICVIQPSSAAVFIVLALIVWVVNLVFSVRKAAGALPVRRVMMQGIAVAAGAVFALVHYVPALWRYGSAEFVRGITRAPTERLGLKISGVGRGLRYGLWDFVWAPASTKINQPTGFGIVLFAVVCAGLVLLIAQWRRTVCSRQRLVVLAWLAFGVLGVLAEYLPVSLFPHRFWVFLAIPAVMLAGEFLAWFTRFLKTSHVVFAVSLGVTVGAAVTLAGLGEALYGLPPVPLSGLRLAMMLLTALASLVGILAGLYFLIDASATGRTWWTGAGTVTLVAGIVLTSVFAKARFQGFSPWDPGRGFYKARVLVREGKVVPLEAGGFVLTEQGRAFVMTDNGLAPLRADGAQLASSVYDLLDYADQRDELRALAAEGGLFTPYLPVLGLTCSDERIIGFDLSTPPFDAEVRQLREDVRAGVHQWVVMTQQGADAKEIDALKRRLVDHIHETAVRKGYGCVSVDHGWAALMMRRRLKAEVRLRDFMRQSGIDKTRAAVLMAGTREAMPHEQEPLRWLRLAADRWNEMAFKEYEAVIMTARLRQLLSESPHFTVARKGRPYGATLFNVKPDEAEPQP